MLNQTKTKGNKMTTTTLAHASIAQGITKVWCVDCFARATTVAELRQIECHPEYLED